eukprot:TRINITY_DN2776_c0_g2_i4.p3 TRINITY_DN2776_c0_g2~~TRINITY_DN2776_c0_g2_i4.p3  ORF type:complete len:107 (-),score=3.44 TRINITY_DN2776_c0_g2_i4:40-360(-)
MFKYNYDVTIEITQQKFVLLRLLNELFEILTLRIGVAQTDMSEELQFRKNYIIRYIGTMFVDEYLLSILKMIMEMQIVDIQVKKKNRKKKGVGKMHRIITLRLFSN